MTDPSLDDLKIRSSALLEKIPYLKILVLFGSRATGEAQAESDWDFAALYDEPLRKAHLKEDAWKWFEVSLILGEIFYLSSDKIDIIDLSRCHPLVADSVAVNGKLIYEKETGEYEKSRKQWILSHTQKQAIGQQLRAKIDIFLQEWGLT